MIKAGIIGGSGYTAGELLRLLAFHPAVVIDFVYSTTHAGNPIAWVHEDLIGTLDSAFTDRVNPDVDLLFLCLGHGKSKQFLTRHAFAQTTRIIDLGQDFRLEADRIFDGKEFVYGLPEINRNTIKSSRYIANPGCFATAIQLALLPLAKAGKLNGDLHINATTGSSGAGMMPSATSHHPWRTGNMSHYKAFCHQHEGEIYRTLRGFHADVDLHFIPNRGDFTRGIFATLYFQYDGSLEDALALFHTYYKEEPFVKITANPISLKMALQTNNCIVSVEKKGRFLLLTSVLDNLVKGASGQAVQNMNLLFGLPETTALQLKPAGF